MLAPNAIPKEPVEAESLVALEYSHFPVDFNTTTAPAVVVPPPPK